MERSCLQLYEPTGTLKPVAPDLWIVDGPEIRMRYFGLRLPFTTRATVVRLPDGRLWVHSPVAPSDALQAELAALGPVGFLVSPNRLHYAWIDAWKTRYPDAVTCGVAGERTWNGVAARWSLDLAGPGPFPWGDVLDQTIVPGDMFSEAVFFHRPTRTLIVTDLIENFERDRINCAWLRLLVGAFGAADPDGSAPYDLRLGFLRRRAAVRACVGEMRAWAPGRIILAHGRWYAGDGMRELNRAFRWVGATAR